MADLLACWVAFPLILGLLAHGAGTVLELLAGRRLAVGIRLPCGLALLMALMDLCTRTTATAPIAVPLAIVVGVAGLMLSRPWRWRLPGWADPATAVGAFAAYAAPIVLSGQATWAGYIKLDDTATWIALADRALSHGRSLAGLAPSTYRSNLSYYLTAGYPLGSFLPLGLGRALVGQDLAWLTDPWMAFMAAMLALALAHIARIALVSRAPAAAGGASSRGAGRARARLQSARASGRAATTSAAKSRTATAKGGKSRPTTKRQPAGRAPEQSSAKDRPRSKPTVARVPTDQPADAPPAAQPQPPPLLRNAPAWQPVVIAVVASQSAILYGYYLWGGMKEMAGAMLVATFAVSLPLALTGKQRLRALIPAVVVVWALVASLSSGGLVWVGPGGALALVVLVIHRLGLQHLREQVRAAGRRAALVTAAALAVLALGAYAVLRPGGFFETYHAVVTGGTQLGNLVKPLSLLQIAGIWPTQDFRYTPNAAWITYVLVALVLASAAGGLYLALRRARSELVLYAFSALLAALLVFIVGSPWVGAKALASASPVLPLTALVAAAWLIGKGHRWLGAVVGALITAGVLWSNGLAFHGVSLAPRQQFAELAQIGHLIAGQGPTLMTEYDTYGERYFLREAAPESASDIRTRRDLLYTGKSLPNGGEADIDDFQVQDTLAYRTLVLQNSPVARRPPSPYKLIFHDTYWSVWQRPAKLSQRVLELEGSPVLPGAVAPCSAIQAIAHVKGATSLVAAPVTAPLAASPTAGTHPASWSDGSYLVLDGAGTATVPLAVHRAGTYSVWLGGSVHGPLTISVDGTKVGRARDVLQYAGQFVPFGTVALPAGDATITLHYTPSILLPGTGGRPDVVGPIVLQPQTAPQQPITVAPADASQLCGRTLEWIEAVGA